jgi:bacteriocin biosynthesis cyclodehydratase domain-containing protein
VYIERVAKTRIGVVCSARLIEPVRAAFAEHGIAVGRAIVPPKDGKLLESPPVTDLFATTDFVIAAAANPVERLQSFPIVNEAAVKAKKAWIAAHLDGDTAIAGPLFIPGETACFNCLELREENHLPNIAEYRMFRALVREMPITSSASARPLGVSLVAQTLASEAVSWIASFLLPATYQTMIELNTVTLESTRHALLKVPLCNVCGPHVERPFQRAWNV